MNSYIITSTGITISFADEGAQHTIESSHPQFKKIVSLATSGEFEEILDLLDVNRAINKFVYSSESGRFSIEDSVLSFDGEEIHSTLADRMVDLALQGLDITAMENFMINLMDNPSKSSVDELYSFLEHGKLPITPDGHFLAYKKIRDDYMDCYTGTMDNSVGKVVSMRRNAVDEDSSRTCSSGLHFCSYDYLNFFGGQRVVVLKINPRDVVAIPADYNDTKGRTCRYEVIRELEDWVGDRIEGSLSSDGTYDDWDDEYEDDDMFGIEEDEAYDDDDGYDELDFDDEDDWDDDDAVMVVVTPAPRLARERIKATRLRDNAVAHFDNVEEAHDETDVPEEYIERVLKGHRQSSFGYRFERVVTTS